MKRYAYLVMILFVSALLMQSAQCTSKEIHSARSAMEAKDYKTALSHIDSELKVNPNNEEAQLLRINIFKMQGKYLDAAKAITLAKKKVKEKKFVDELKRLDTELWKTSYNSGIGNYNKYINSKEQKFVDSAVYYFDIAETLRPKRLEFVSTKGDLLEVSGNSKRSQIEYKRYIDLIKPEIQFAKKHNLYLKQPYADVISKFGNSIISYPGLIGKDSINVENYLVDGDDIYFYSTKKTGEQWTLVGWRLNLPSDWPVDEKMILVKLVTTPITAVAQYAYEAKDYATSTNMINQLIILEPFNQDAFRFKVIILTTQGKSDEAITELKGLTKDYPKNKFHWLQYADLLANMDKNDEAIDKYKKALDIDPTFDFAIRNIASVLKNKASDIQKKLMAEKEKDKKIVVDVDKYFPILKESASYFEKCLKTEQFKNDYKVLNELANIYIVTNETEKIDPTIKKLESIENRVPKADKEGYYLSLLKIYSDRRDEKKTTEIQNKLENLK